MKLNFEQEVLVLPGSVLQQNADAVQLRVLLWLASDLTLAQKHRQLAKLADCSTAEVADAIAFWSGCGVLSAQDTKQGGAVAVMATVQEPAAAQPAKAQRKPLLRRADELPTYTSAELADLMEKRASVRALIDEAQQILGKLFNIGELNILVGMADYLGMSEECILMLLSHCSRIGKTNLRAIEKYAYSLVDRDITEPAALEEEIRTVEAMHSFEGQVREMFGMKRRALTSRENKMLRAWISFGYDIEIVRRAYELTIGSTNEPSVPYTNAILERWNAEGLRTAQQIDAAMEEQKNKKEGKGQKPTAPTLGNSFDTDDFFDAALRRTFANLDDGDA